MQETAADPKVARLFADRLQRIRSAMSDKELDAVVIYKPMGEHYAYGGIGYARYVMVPWITIPLPPAFIVIPSEGEVICSLLGGLGAQYLIQEVPGLKVDDDAPMIEMRRGVATEMIRRLATLMADVRVADGSIGLVLYSELPRWMHEDLVNFLPSASFSDATAILDDLMMLKSSEEIGCIRRAAALADKAFETIFSTMKPGIGENEVVAEAQYEVMRQGAAYADIRVSTGIPGDPRGGVRPPSDKRVALGDHIHVGIDLAYRDYWANVVRRGVVGRASQDHKRLFDVVIEMQQAAMAEMKPGLQVSSAFFAAASVVEAAAKAGLFDNFRLQRLGHGIGLENQERPFLIRTEGCIFQPNMVFALHPGLQVQNRGQVANGDILLVRDTGPDLLTTFPRALVEVA